MRRFSHLLRIIASLGLCAVLSVASERAVATVISAAPVDFSSNEAASFNGGVATFQDDNPSATPADFNASIDWGDGSTSTAGTIGSSSAAFVVTGGHTYADEGSFTVTVTINDNSPGTGTATITSTATITEADSLSGTALNFSGPAGTSVTPVVATFKDTNTANVASDFTARIDWGDATVTAGVVSGGNGGFSVSGTHTYAATGTFSVTVTLSDDAPGTATATVVSTAHINPPGLAATATSISGKEFVPFNGNVAIFSDSDTTQLASAFTATIDWGDGTTTAGTITGAAGSFTVSAQHTYADEGSFTLSVTVSGPGGAMATSNATATIAEADVLAGAAITFNATAGTPFTGVVANFTDTISTNVASDFTATINWGDATASSAGTVSAAGSGGFSVNGTHTYAALGTFSVTVTLSDDAPGTATAQVVSTAQVLTISQAIAFTSTPPSYPLVGSSYTVTATGGASGNPVVFSIDPTSTAGACTIAGSTVSFTGVGTCIIDANQAGGGSYSAAPQVQQTLTIGIRVPPAPAPLLDRWTLLALGLLLGLIGLAGQRRTDG